MVSNEVYLLPLKDDGSPDLWVNIPEERCKIPERSVRQFKLEPDFNRTIEISIPIHSAGAFAFYTTYKALPDLDDTNTAPIETTKSPVYYIDVAPTLKLDGRQLPLPAFERGYNMVHFTPLQKRGESNSPYSIYDQLAWDPECFPNGEKDIKKLIKSMEVDYGLLGLTDVVWNHTANNSAWLEEHPEVGYNVSTAPWLRSALELDTKLLEFSKDLANQGLPTTLNSVDDLVKVMAGVKTEVIAKLRLWEYYVIHVERDADAVVEAWAANKISFPDGGFGGSGFGGLEAIKNAPVAEQATFLREKGVLNTDRLGERYRRKVDPEVGAALLTALFGRFEGDDSNSADRAEARSRLTNILDEVNLPYYKEYDVDVAEILDQLFNRTKICST
ncbi:hypothetical protein EYC84_007162 [Monilinia fructicola]|uniref:Glycosyl hydrolase family 13 catalytic domain-containing protein n=1 Tax=Monilinia fructicola TaxID=38448 RepID=A0A5M9KDW6_MONFR|nr:hypothetical protein EYC84_007162 [Monilinia fructicola]